MICCNIVSLFPSAIVFSCKHSCIETAAVPMHPLHQHLSSIALSGLVRRNHCRRHHCTISRSIAGQGDRTPKNRSKSGRLCTRAVAQTPAVLMPEKKTGVLFVCLGNICRSPTAAAVFKAVVERAGRAEHCSIDSCGTGGGNPGWYKENGWAYHEGHESDDRMMAAASKRGVCLTSRSRPLRPEDLRSFDYILGMDHENIAAIQLAADYWALREKDIPKDYRSKVQLMCKYLDKQGAFKGIMEVPDPYYGGQRGFELVLDLLEDACQGLLSHILEHDMATAA